MTIFSWNIRGLNSQSRQRIVRSWVVSNKLLVGSFLETHVEKENAATVLASTLLGWRMDNNYWCSEMGRIWLCRRLNREGFGNLQQRTSEALAALEDIQSQLLSLPSDSLFRQEHMARKKWDFFAVALESFYRQKSRIRWLKEGDANTRFFRRAFLAHQARNLIKQLRGDNDILVVNVDQVKDMIVAYYSHLLGSENDSTIPLSIKVIKVLHPFGCDESLATLLSAIPTDEEIIGSVFSMPKNKAPNPYGFRVDFFWDSWAVVNDTVIFATNYLSSDRFLVGIQFTKFTGIISKRLKLFRTQAVQGNQVGFIKGRMLCENVLLASELVEGLHIEGEVTKGCLQIDLTKAYDNVSWEFLINILVALDLPPIFINLIRDSVAGIISILDEFRIGSRLGINRQKTAFLLDGGDLHNVATISERFGVSQGVLPVRYLGIPLMT
ncbi:putative RNA-directed DNA polymerase [Arabidopsis thaliana]